MATKVNIGANNFIELSFITEIYEGELEYQFNLRERLRPLEIAREFNARRHSLEQLIEASSERARNVDGILQMYHEQNKMNGHGK